MRMNPSAKEGVEHLLPVVLGSGKVAFARGVRAGPWVFVNGTLATDFRNGLPPDLVHPRLPLHGDSKHALEANALLARAHEVLEAGGSDFAHVVRIDQFYSNWRAVEHYQAARRQHFGTYIPPSTSILEEELLLAGAEMEVSMIAVAPPRDLRVEVFSPPELELPARAGFSPIVCVGDHVFIAGFMAAWRPGDLGGIAPEAQVPPGHLWKGTRIKLETEYLVEKKLKPALNAAGASMDSVVKAQVFLADVQDIPAFNEVWRRYFANSAPASLIVPTSRPGFAIADATIEINLVALREAGSIKKQVIQVPRFTGFCGQPAAIRAGDLLLVSGLMGIDRDGPVPGVARSDRSPYFGASIDHQMEHILAVAQEVCAAAGTRLANVVRIQQFHTDLAEFYPSYRIWQRHMGSAPLPFSAIRVPGPLPVLECSVIVDLWIYVPPTVKAGH
jgi:enamine deaminase RidA (YjgF/YER057c/UK114 family)